MSLISEARKFYFPKKLEFKTGASAKVTKGQTGSHKRKGEVEIPVLKSGETVEIADYYYVTRKWIVRQDGGATWILHESEMELIP